MTLAWSTQPSPMETRFPSEEPAPILAAMPMREPLRGTKVHVEELLEASEDAAALVDALQR